MERGNYEMHFSVLKLVLKFFHCVEKKWDTVQFGFNITIF